MKANQLICAFTMMLTVTASVEAQNGPRGGGRGFPPPGRGPQGPGGIERLLDDLPLGNMQQGLDARAALVAYDQAVRQQTQQARVALLDKMHGILSEDQFSRFSEALNEVPLVPGVPPRLRGVATVDLVDRVMAFDKNQDGKITKEELPERMANLLEHGDANHDGSLDKQELSTLATQASVNDRPGPRGGGRGGRGGRGGPPPGGGRGGFPPGPPDDQQ